MRSLSCAWLLALTISGCTGVASETSPAAGGAAAASAEGGRTSSSAGATASDGGALPSTAGGSGVSAGTGGGPSASCAPLPPLTRRLWRLSVEQFQSAVRDLLQLPKAPLLSNRGGEAQWAFFGDVSLGVDDSFEYALYRAVDEVLPSIPASVTACRANEAPRDCATRIASDFGSRAFRRPLSAAEIAALVSNPAAPASGTDRAVSAAPFSSAGADTQLGIKLMIEAILLSPSFIYRTELGPDSLSPDANGNYPVAQLTPYETATQLAFTFLGSTPDAALISAAADSSDKGLSSPTGVAAQVDRLLALPAVKQNLSTIIAGWFDIGQVFLKTHDSSLLSALSSADQADQSGVQNDLYSAAQQLITDVLWTRSGAITDLLTTQEGFFNSRLAALYPGVTFPNGAPTSATTFVVGTWPESENRIGLLTDPSYFWAQSDPAANSIVKRGKAIHDDILCADPLPPPVDLNTPEALAVIAKGDSEVTKSDARLATSPCNACHQQMDNYSRLLQHFGPTGNYRELDEAGRAIDTRVTFSGASPLAPQAIAGPRDFARALIESGHMSGCAVQKISSYLIGAMLQKYDSCELETLRAQFNNTDGSLASLFRTVILADFARTRTGGKQ